jgi:ATP phosphoribosyltransferase regulatory subunit
LPVLSFLNGIDLNSDVMKITPIPSGMKDILPAEAAELRLLEAAIRGVFDSYGYGEVVTPTLELESALETAGESRFRASFRLFDEKGDVLVLRPEMTTPIARLLATKMADRSAPFRLSYFANSFRPTRPQRGRQSEFYQAGLEFAGPDSAAADAEVLTIACQSLIACGLQDFTLVLGEASFFRALLESLGVSSSGREAIFGSIAARDMVALGGVVRDLDLAEKDRRTLLDAVSMRGGAEILTVARDIATGDEMEEALKRLARTYYLLSRQGFAGRILFDIGLLRNFDYYTGIVFEVLSGDLGFPLGGGGRYNGLLERFGRPMPAMGFALGLDRLHIAVAEQGGVRSDGVPSVVLGGGLDVNLETATRLRQSGVRVFSLDNGASEEEALSQASDNGFAFVAMPVTGDKQTEFRLVETVSGDSLLVSPEELLARVTG